ncbi:hypothetical protein DMR_00840 [Solidesulfovibrio magneticus RS-1]|uniref:Uncharacterized protein n=1 Tax=Solidesulfovibrio magneticus (strain ATCC 700980 / DSM 13731 / RS-1) TaxID=573370 RepID=C4XTR0_SOLM1|nr:hypothetical protein DMR_00840 [Solidesulfovibrio magneticus RS-1]
MHIMPAKRRRKPEPRPRNEFKKSHYIKDLIKKFALANILLNPLNLLENFNLLIISVS